MLAGRAVEQEAVAEVGAFQASFAVPGRAQVASGEGARTLRLAASTLEPDLVSRVVPSLDVTAFLEARFRHGEDVPLMAGRSRSIATASSPDAARSARRRARTR